ncbi:hypothetical protein AK812_SmicGene42801 [Symbiodinium microadriaticum]|uniref:Uncharacterized protein n=1 Tax=Symbiodinium microadriaticum TaxID=2951 RepID=A0A1Q9C2N3_SYMMI|nr:hypothetical protein AK812_SmicGene42801 [Symbiodinium microadriaticum]
MRVATWRKAFALTAVAAAWKSVRESTDEQAALACLQTEVLDEMTDLWIDARVQRPTGELSSGRRRAAAMVVDRLDLEAFIHQGCKAFRWFVKQAELSWRVRVAGPTAKRERCYARPLLGDSRQGNVSQGKDGKRLCTDYNLGRCHVTLRAEPDKCVVE